MMDFLLHSAFVEELLDKLMQLHLDALDKILHIKALDCIRFGDDFGGQKGLLMGQTHWRKFFKPRLRKMYGKARDAGKVVSIHSCDNNQHIAEMEQRIQELEQQLKKQTASQDYARKASETHGTANDITATSKIVAFSENKHQQHNKNRGA